VCLSDLIIIDRDGTVGFGRQEIMASDSSELRRKPHETTKLYLSHEAGSRQPSPIYQSRVREVHGRAFWTASGEAVLKCESVRIP